jgi:hypothetical protein
MKYLSIVLVFMLFAVGGCSWVKRNPEPQALPYKGTALHNMKLGRGYQAEGRYELARDRFLQALALAEHEDMKDAVIKELEATDKLIRSQR